MTDDQLQKITWELSLEDHDAFQPVEPISKTAENMSFRPVDPPCAAFNWFLFQAVGEQHRWGGRGDWDQAKWNELIDKPTFETWVGYLEGTPVGYADVVGSGRSKLAFPEVPAERAGEYLCEAADLTGQLAKQQYTHFSRGLMANLKDYRRNPDFSRKILTGDIDPTTLAGKSTSFSRGSIMAVIL